jgi:hypothetical protein
MSRYAFDPVALVRATYRCTLAVHRSAHLAHALVTMGVPDAHCVLVDLPGFTSLLPSETLGLAYQTGQLISGNDSGSFGSQSFCESLGTLTCDPPWYSCVNKMLTVVLHRIESWDIQPDHHVDPVSQLCLLPPLLMRTSDQNLDRLSLLVVEISNETSNRAINDFGDNLVRDRDVVVICLRDYLIV